MHFQEDTTGLLSVPKDHFCLIKHIAQFDAHAHDKKNLRMLNQMDKF